MWLHTTEQVLYCEKVSFSALLTITNTPQVLSWGHWRHWNICSKYFPPPPSSRQKYSSSVSYSRIHSYIHTRPWPSFPFFPYPKSTSLFLHPIPSLPPCSCSLLLPNPLYYITHFLPFLAPLALSPRPWVPHAFFCTDALCLQDRSLLDFPFL